MEQLLIELVWNFNRSRTKILGFRHWKNCQRFWAANILEFQRASNHRVFRSTDMCPYRTSADVERSFSAYRPILGEKKLATNPNILRWCLFVTAFTTFLMVSSHTKFPINLVAYATCLIPCYRENKVNCTKLGFRGLCSLKFIIYLLMHCGSTY